MRGNWERDLLRALIGLAAGYIAFLPALAIHQILSFGKWDGERFLHGLGLPFQLPFALLPGFLTSYSNEEIFLQVVGMACMVVMCRSLFTAPKIHHL